MRFKGAFVALVTPFKDGKVDRKKLTELVDLQLAAGIDGIVPCGTTGEAPTLSDEERRIVVKSVVARVKGRVPVIAGAGGNDTRRTVGSLKDARRAGADGVLVVTPYYNRPTQEGLLLHFRAVAAATRLPVIAYNVPSRTGVSFAAETLERLAAEKKIVAVKEASGSMDLVCALARTRRLDVLSGDDPLTMPIMAAGGVGVISVLANIAPGSVAKLTRMCLVGDFVRARELHEQLYPLAKAMFMETNPIPVKTAMRMLGMCNGELRLPLCPMGREKADKLSTILRACKGLLRN
ncbi:MAG: 4-hydroxy-tetrahydrodipicolinate synthase [Planctomycetota bacterium]|nr:4-hydroxy-tetrahydrodipicolinate synthase [Planctomycetota bacterium]